MRNIPRVMFDRNRPTKGSRGRRTYVRQVGSFQFGRTKPFMIPKTEEGCNPLNQNVFGKVSQSFATPVADMLEDRRRGQEITTPVVFGVHI
jgi:hypothetical protein